MRSTINRENIEGRIYDFTLEKKVTGPTSKNPGTPYIAGDIDIATDEEGLNIVTVHYSYVTAVTSTGKTDKAYPVLMDIIDKGKTIIKDGKDNATCVRCSGTALALNEFYTEKAKTDTNPDGLVSSKRNEKGFISIVSKLNPDEEKRNFFETDMLINKVRLVEADPENNVPTDYLILKGVVFSFNGNFLPMDFVVRDQGGIKYFESLEISEKKPVFTKVWGAIKSQTVVSTKEEANAFGQAIVKETSRTIREWEVTGAAQEPYVIGDEENGITVEEITKKIQDRNTYLAEVKTRQEEYNKSKNSGAIASAAPAVAATPVTADFNF